MKIEHLQYFLEVTRTHSMNIAGQNLHIAQQTISAAIQSLENELGLTLCTRTNKGAFLTLDGQYLADEAQVIMDTLARIDHYTQIVQQQAEPTIVDTLSFVCAPIFSQTMVPPILDALSQQYPHVNLNHLEKPPLVCLSEVQEKNFDVALLNIGTDYYDHSLKDWTSPTHHLEILVKDRLVALVSRHSPLAHKQYITKRDLLNTALVLYTNEDWQHNWVQNILFPNSKEQPKKILQTSSISLHISAVASGNHIGFFSKRFAHDALFVPYLNLVKCVPLRQPVEQYFVLLYQSQRAKEPHVQELIRLLKDELTSPPGAPKTSNKKRNE